MLYTLFARPLSETRWECRVESVKAVKYQLSDICNAMKDLAENTTDCQLVSEGGGLLGPGVFFILYFSCHFIS